MDKVDDKNELTKSVNDKSSPAYAHQMVKESINPSNKNQSATFIPQQNQLFSLQDELHAIDPDTLTPKQAHDLLYHLKEIISHQREL